MYSLVTDTLTRLLEGLGTKFALVPPSAGGGGGVFTARLIFPPSPFNFDQIPYFCMFRVVPLQIGFTGQVFLAKPTHVPWFRMGVPRQVGSRLFVGLYVCVQPVLNGGIKGNDSILRTLRTSTRITNKLFGK